ncbi:hypothetical protein APA_965 [Pseudanabaena sp. lw0831]|nr:hypothetical protein APA_965 [Pseudanabaena sp. lw0831]
MRGGAMRRLSSFGFLCLTVLYAQTRTNKFFKSVAKQHF